MKLLCIFNIQKDVQEGQVEKNHGFWTLSKIRLFDFAGIVVKWN